MPETPNIFDLLGTGLLSAEVEQTFLRWCMLQTVRPAFAHALSTHDMVSEGRTMMTATTPEAVSALATRVSEGTRGTMFRQLALWIRRAIDYKEPRAAWDAAREAAIWSLIYSQRARDTNSQVEQYHQFDKQIRQTHASRLREISGYPA